MVWCLYDAQVPTLVLSYLIKNSFYPLFLLIQHIIRVQKYLYQGEENHEHNGDKEEGETYDIACWQGGGQGKDVGDKIG